MQGDGPVERPGHGRLAAADDPGRAAQGFHVKRVVFLAQLGVTLHSCSRRADGGGGANRGGLEVLLDWGRHGGGGGRPRHRRLRKLRRGRRRRRRWQACHLE